MSVALTTGTIRWISWRSTRELVRAADRQNAARNWSDAADLYAKALEINPKLGKLWVQLGHCYKEQARLHDAENAYRNAVSFLKKDYDAHLHFAHCLKLLNRPTDALAAFERCQQLAPENAEPLREMTALKGMLGLPAHGPKPLSEPPPAKHKFSAFGGLKLPIDLHAYASANQLSLEDAFADYCADPAGPQFAPATKRYYITYEYARELQFKSDIQAIRTLFDELFYLRVYSDIRNLDPLEHFCNYGWKEQRDPSSNFCTQHYLANNPDLVSEQINPLFHYALFGQRSGQTTAKSRVIPIGQAPRNASNLKLDPNARLVTVPELRRFAFETARALAPADTTFDPARLRLHWVVPDFSPGGGGHMTIFRICQQLEARGHQITIWIRDPNQHRTEAAAKQTLIRSFLPLAADVHFVDERFQTASGDIIFATDAFTVPIVTSAENFKRRFYFVQDFEPSFHPRGSRYLLSEATYLEDLDCICAGPWLETLMRERYGHWAKSFPLAADTDVYHPSQEDRGLTRVPRIAFYTRMFTERRAVELGLLALELLAKRGVSFHVDFFGQEELPFTSCPFPAQNHGVCNAEQLANLYRRADLGVVFSATNYSLVPQEMMACDLPVLDLDVESTRAAYPSGVAMTAKPSPRDIADTIAEALERGPEVVAQIDKARNWIADFSWSNSAKIVESACLERLSELHFEPKSPGILIHPGPFATVVIPTYNGGELLKRVIQSVERQVTPGEVEILCIDSSSTDGTNEYLSAHPSVKLITIEQKQFQHGRTRNLGVEHASSEFVAFLTQDSLPADDLWLYSLVNVLISYPNAGGVCGRHKAYPDTSPFIRRDLAEFMASFDSLPTMIDLSQPEMRRRASDPGLRQQLHWYSDNNSCLRKSIWRKCPIPNVDFGEDQAFAWSLLMKGYGKAYSTGALVYHSHDDEPDVVRRRACEEARFFYSEFGYRPFSNLHSARIDLLHLNERDQQWSEANGIDERLLERRLNQNRATVLGRVDAMVEAKVLPAESADCL